MSPGVWVITHGPGTEVVLLPVSSHGVRRATPVSAQREAFFPSLAALFPLSFVLLLSKGGRLCEKSVGTGSPEWQADERAGRERHPRCGTRTRVHYRHRAAQSGSAKQKSKREALQ